MIRRRQRIADMHNEMKKFINKCDYVFLVEDDTLLPKDALTKLLQGFEKYPDAGFVSGVQVGRWGFEILGAWRTDNAFEPEQITSTKLEEGIQEVDGAGFYCCLVRKENYIDHNFAPFEKILGADVNFGFSLRKKGLKNYVDYSIHCDHVTKKEVLSVDTAKIVQVEFNREPSNNFGWEQRSY
jgi:GT2 family glycosyltransferase